MIGPRVGDRFPDLRLLDQRGQVVDLHAARAGRRALVVFYRSADWCSFCKTQLVELRKAAPALTTQDVALSAVSYDPVEILRVFTTEHGIDSPPLSDEGCHDMRRRGLLNERVQEDHAASYTSTFFSKRTSMTATTSSSKASTLLRKHVGYFSMRPTCL